LAIKVLTAEILACKGAVPLSYLRIIASGLKEKENSVLIGGFHPFAVRIELITGLLVLVSIKTFSNCSKKGIKV